MKKKKEEEEEEEEDEDEKQELEFAEGFRRIKNASKKDTKTKKEVNGFFSIKNMDLMDEGRIKRPA